MTPRLVPALLVSGVLLGGGLVSGFVFSGSFAGTSNTAIKRSPTAALESVKFMADDGAGESRLLVALSKPVSPRLRFVPSEECWQVDLPDTGNASMPIALPGDGGIVRLIRSATVGHDPEVTRLSLFVRHGTGVKVMTREGGFELCLTQGGKPESPGSDQPSGRATALPNGLLAPVVVKEEVVLQLERSAPIPLLNELARRAGIAPRFRDAPPKTVSCRGSAANPIAALHLLAKAMNMVLVDEGDAWRFTHRANPLLKIPVGQRIDGTEFEGRPLRDVLASLAGQERGEVWATKLGVAAGRPLRGLSGERLSKRCWTERLLKAHGLAPDKEPDHG